MKKLVLPLVLILAILGSTTAFAAGSLNLPNYLVNGSYGPWAQGTWSPFDITLSGVGAGFDVADGTYPGWCLERALTISSDRVILYSTDDTAMPADVAGLPWNQINYLLNHKMGSVFDVQEALWVLIGQLTFGDVGTTAQAMVQDAMTNGASFKPGPGQIISVLLYSDGYRTQIDQYQEMIIELQIPDRRSPGTGTPGYWKTHPEAWPVDNITIGGVTYTKEQALMYMGLPDGDKTLTIFRALVAAKLNVLIGNEDSCIASTISAADAWMAAYGPVGSEVKAKSAAWKLGEPLYLMLDQYNNGLLCAPHRD